MDRWSQLSMSEKSDLMSLYIKNGISSLEEIKKHYNSFADGGGPIKKGTVGELVDALYKATKRDVFLGEPSHHYDFTQSEEWANAHGYYPDSRGHRDDRVKKPTHPSHPSRGTWNGDYYELTDKGLDNVNYTLFGLNDGGQDSQAILTYKGSRVLPAITVTPEGNYIENPYDNRRLYFATGGSLNEPPNNIDNISSGRWVQVDNETVTPEYSLPTVTIEAEHPLWSLPWYKDKKNNPNINRYKDQLYNNWRRHNEAGKEYLKRVAGGLSTMALPIGGAAGFILGVPDLATDFAEMIDKPSISNATELTLDAPTRYGTELDNALISVLESNRYTKPLAKILQYNDALQYIGAINDASSAITGKSIIEHVSK